MAKIQPQRLIDLRGTTGHIEIITDAGIIRVHPHLVTVARKPSGRQCVAIEVEANREVNLATPSGYAWEIEYDEKYTGGPRCEVTITKALS